MKHFTFQAAAGDAGADAGGGSGDVIVDRGDDFTPTDDDPKEQKDALEKAEAEKLAADEKALKDKEEKDAADAAALAADDPETVAAAAAKAEEEEKNKGKGKDTRIPAARHKEILEKERALRTDLENKLAKFEKGQAVAVTNEQITKDETALLTLESEYAKLVVDGDHVKAAETMRKIRTTERGIIEAKSVMTTQAAEARAYERVRYDTTVERLEAAYPVLNPDDEEHYDSKTVDKVTRLMRSYQNEDGLPPAMAIQRAVKDILGSDTAKQEDAVTIKARVDAEDAAKKVAEDRRKQQIAKNLAAAGKQPPNSKGVGADADRAGGTLRGADAIKLPYQDFIKLDETQLSKLRGDALA